MKALLVTLNGQRVRLAGIDTSDCSVMAMVIVGREGDRWYTRWDVGIIDKSAEKSGGWPALPFNKGDVIGIQLVESEAVDECEDWISHDAICHLVPEPEVYRPWEPPDGRMTALIVERNGQRVRLAGSDSPDWTISSIVHWTRNSNGEGATADTVLVDGSRGEGGGWPWEMVELGDVVTLRLMDCDQADKSEFLMEIPSLSQSS